MAIVHDVTFEEKYANKKYSLLYFKIFGCIAYVQILDELHSKSVLASSSIQQKSVSYNLITHELRVSKDVFVNG